MNDHSIMLNTEGKDGGKPIRSLSQVSHGERRLHPMDRAWGASGWCFGPSGVCVGHQDALTVAGLQGAHLWMFYDLQNVLSSSGAIRLHQGLEEHFKQARLCIYAFESKDPLEADRIRHQVLVPCFEQEVCTQVQRQGGIAKPFGIGVWQMEPNVLVCVSLDTSEQHCADVMVQNTMRKGLAKHNLIMIGMQTQRYKPVANTPPHAVPIDWFERLRAFKSEQEHRALTWHLGWNEKETQKQKESKRL